MPGDCNFPFKCVLLEKKKKKKKKKKKETLLFSKINIRFWTFKFTSHNHYSLGNLFYLNAKNTQTTQNILQVFALYLKKNRLTNLQILRS